MIYHWDIIGHEKPLQLLEGDITTGNLHHAYLFVGAPHIGKSAIAKQMAMILQCPNDFCRSCPTCTQVEKMSHVDTIELIDDDESIKVSTIRDLIGRLSMTSQSSYKIVIIDNVKRFTTEAANAFLKTLEEPTPRTIFIFTAPSIQDVLPTLVSRMRVIHFKKHPAAILKSALQQRFAHIDNLTMDYIINLSLGSSGRAIELLSDPDTFESLRNRYQEIEFHYEKKDFVRWYKEMGEISKDPIELRKVLGLLTHFLRTRLLYSPMPLGQDETQKIVYAIERIHRAQRLLEQNVNGRLLLEDILIRL